MGIGDDIIATGMARGAKDRRKRIAFGDGRYIRWGPYSEMIFKNNSNIARPGSEKDKDIEWVNYYKGHRMYNSASAGRWCWNYSFKVKHGEIFFDESENILIDGDFIFIEPNVPSKPCGPNKQWPLDRFREVVKELSKHHMVIQPDYGAPARVAPGVGTPTFRHAAALMKKAKLAILPEGGLHHAAAAVGTRAIVLFGGFAPPKVLGYDDHINLTGGAEACGSFKECSHCLQAMRKIGIDEVLAAVEKIK